MEALRNVDNLEPGTALFQQVQREVRKTFPQTPQYGGAKSAGHQAGVITCLSSGSWEKYSEYRVLALISALAA